MTPRDTEGCCKVRCKLRGENPGDSRCPAVAAPLVASPEWEFSYTTASLQRDGCGYSVRHRRRAAGAGSRGRDADEPLSSAFQA